MNILLLCKPWHIWTKYQTLLGTHSFHHSIGEPILSVWVGSMNESILYMEENLSTQSIGDTNHWKPLKIA